MNGKVLIVEDDSIQRELLEESLNEKGFVVVSASSAEEGKSILEKENVDVVVTDVKLPGKSGIAFLKEIKNTRPETEVVIITAFSNIEDAVEAIKAGAFHYITKPYDIDVLTNLLNKCCELSRLRKKPESSDFIFKSPVMKNLISTVNIFAKSDAPILITGESGTGKEVIARYIHKISERKGKFIPVNCTSIPENLFESELFGYEKGAFSGATKSKPGLIEEADKGTLFLDEIGDLPLYLQAKLLRFLQEKEVRRVGGLSTRKVDVRIVAATNRNLEEAVKKGEFREDLFYRLNVLRVEIPPLRERKEDIVELTGFFLKKFNTKYGKKVILSKDALNTLLNYTFPGNVRELENIIHRAVLIAENEITSEHLLIKSNSSDIRKTLPEQIEELEKKLIKEALEKAGYVQTKAAKLLGIDEKSLRYKRKKYGI
ncbi:sigma-54-dependent transcriptional regulator [Desulfurobacterium atlanticum]|uniref:DNA-binding transcriptional response regulator, NtrC family, contains REC, AAA-type ATPase, and a Fis-type DNA-binding domains n=1 Tax=Desulfurobacterium atlanticum TaxID=240169 RepID=A0A238ZSG4_9BACT|nr:sigma-54 dependent transcriptional regulator [Desulfurobacterium atlanticum]SNR86139.1 DNA-binding transcriptional response regulator, NtrC family, contains REC, AAA-type ATPase, and a Fis-type DNA-binding domains [Desulfurobacterium atlanticum]